MLSNKAAVIPLWPGEQPKTSEVKDWFTASKPFITPDQLAVYSRTEPRGLLDFTAATVPEALIVTAENRTTESTRQQRLALIMSITDSNNLKALKREAFKSELAQGLFDALDRAVRPQAPLCGPSSSGCASSLLLLSITSTVGRPSARSRTAPADTLR